jgi:hypothetical protein
LLPFKDGNGLKQKKDMQKNVKNLVKTIAEQKNTANTVFNHANTAQEFMTLLSQKSFYENYSLLYYAALFFALVSQLATAVSSYTFFFDLIAIKLPLWGAGGATILLLLLLEALKYVSFNKGLEGVFALPQRINYVLLVFAMLLCAASMYASIVGGGNFGIDTQRISTTETKFDTEIATLRTEIAAIHDRNTWKGNTYLGKKEKALVYQKEQELAKVKLNKENGLKSVAQDNEIAATQYKFGFAFFDALFILCTLYVWYFRKQVAIEAMVETQTTSPPTPEGATFRPHNSVFAPPSRGGRLPKKDYLRNTPLIRDDYAKKVGNENRNNENRQEEEILEKRHDENRIDENRQVIGVRNCLQCQTEFVANHKKQKYCCDDCRKVAWENKTKRPLILKKKSAIVQPLDLFS